MDVFQDVLNKIKEVFEMIKKFFEDLFASLKGEEGTTDAQ